MFDDPVFQFPTDVLCNSSFLFFVLRFAHPACWSLLDVVELFPIGRWVVGGALSLSLFPLVVYVFVNASRLELLYSVCYFVIFVLVLFPLLFTL